MQRPVIFFDLAGTLDVRRPDTGRWGLWPGADAVLADLAVDFDLHLTTGEGPASAGPSLTDLGVREYFTGIHAGLPGGGKPFGVIAATLGVPAERCLAVGDSASNDTAGDTDRIASVILVNGKHLVDPVRLAAVVRALWSEGSFMEGFAAALTAAAGADPADAGAGGFLTDVLHASELGGGCSLGWWRKTSASRRAVVMLTA